MGTHLAVNAGEILNVPWRSGCAQCEHEEGNSEADCEGPRFTGNPRTLNFILRTMEEYSRYSKLMDDFSTLVLQSKIISQCSY